MNAVQQVHRKERLYTLAIRAGELSNWFFELRRDLRQIERPTTRARLKSDAAMLRAWADELDVLAAGGVL